MASSQTLKRSYTRTKPYPEKKVRIVNELKELFSKYESLFIIDLHETSNRVIQEYRFWMRRRGAKIIKAKNTLAILALKQLLGEVPSEIENIFTGENLFIFTNENPFEFIRWIQENGIRREARPGDIAPFELVVPAGNTGMSPGPVMSKFGKLKIPIRVQDGKIWVAKDTVVAKPGDKINEDIADILSKLKVKPIFEALKVKAVLYKMRRVIKMEELTLDLRQYRGMFEDAAKYALNLAVNAVYPTPEVLRIAVGRAYMEAMNLAINAGYIIPETAQQLLTKAVFQAQALAAVIAPKAPQLNLQVTTRVAPQTAQAPAEAKGEEKKAEEKKEGEEEKGGPSEEEIASSFTSLFG